jgi:hypothetical protein
MPSTYFHEHPRFRVGCSRNPLTSGSTGLTGECPQAKKGCLHNGLVRVTTWLLALSLTWWREVVVLVCPACRPLPLGRSQAFQAARAQR